MKKTLLTGLYAGVIGAVAALAVTYLLGTATGLWFEQLTWFSIGGAAILANIMGALIFSKFFRKTKRARGYYALLTLGVTLLMTMNDLANPPAVKFGIIAHPVHAVVAVLTIWLVPEWLKSEDKTERSVPRRSNVAE
ncbi:hypothetical protein MUN89_20590 [Halobacillus salinarum]|uniref:DUF4383 domain-containing protein n=1 Tax=Halobacillus salinarum TaxID=2932257 RepID=A0ABY4EKZ0_9BACI|nr:hypothetical protein [Halobacillus salinarum]UOQ44222.1 hypothetical protein MUN89_20590 [Halobacillus salinarum]